MSGEKKKLSIKKRFPENVEISFFCRFIHFVKWKSRNWRNFVSRRNRTNLLRWNPGFQNVTEVWNLQSTGYFIPCYMRVKMKYVCGNPVLAKSAELCGVHWTLLSPHSADFRVHFQQFAHFRTHFCNFCKQASKYFFLPIGISLTTWQFFVDFLHDKFMVRIWVCREGSGWINCETWWTPPDRAWPSFSSISALNLAI